MSYPFPSDEPNPLRPYHVPRHQTAPIPTSTSKAASNATTRGSSKPSLSSSARDMLADLDYGDYISDASPSIAETLKSLLDQGLWKYTAILCSQPFEVAKTILQVQLPTAVAEHHAPRNSFRQTRKASSYKPNLYEVSDDSDNDSSSYFTSSAPQGTVRSSRRRQSHRSSSRSPSISSHRSNVKATPVSLSHPISSTSSITAVISHLWNREGAWGVWKGSNSTFIYSVSASTMTTFIRSTICAILNLPEPRIAGSAGSPVDVLSSPSPLLSLLSTVLASSLTAILLAPVDIARTVHMLTPTSQSKRGLLGTVSALPSFIAPIFLLPVTLLHGALPSLFTAGTPLFLRAKMGIDPIVTPTSYAIATFLSQALELAARLPIETVLRRGQLSYAGSGSSSQQGKLKSLPTTVEVGPYKGTLGTMYHIVFEEGSTAQPGQSEALQRQRKGQGLEGLFRGWRIGVWGLAGMWGAAMIGGGKGGEF